MLGVFDSGRGGLSALSELRELLPNADIAYHADLRNLPYGTKESAVLVPLITRGISCLIERGCERVLIGCVTASSLYDLLPQHVRACSYPITDAVARAAVRASSSGRIGICATERTCREGALCRALYAHGATHVSVSVGEGLVELVERERTDPFDPEVLSAVGHTLPSHLLAKIDTLVLGCTHYPSLSAAYRRLLPSEVTLISSGAEGARGFAATLTHAQCRGKGKTLFF